MSDPAVPVGFDYARALLEIKKYRTHEEIAAFVGYESIGSISNILNGRIPNHPQGEAIFTLYREIFGKKPPMTSEQSNGVRADIHKRASVGTTSNRLIQP